MSTQKNNATIVTEATKRVNALQKHLKNTKVEIPFQGALVKPAVLLAIFQNTLDTRAAVTESHAAYLAALKERDDAEGPRLAADESLKGWVLSRYGAGSTEANEFGYAARKKPVVSAETRAEAVKLNQATRDARGTKGKKQRLSIKGVLMTPTAPAAPAQVVTAASGAVAAPPPTTAAAVPATPAPAPVIAVPAPAPAAALATGVTHTP